MAKITYLKGDATRPIGNGKKIICQINNDLGYWASGFVMAVSAHWNEPELAYRQRKIELDKKGNYILGTVQFVPVENDIFVANMIGQHGIGMDKEGNPPIRYFAIIEALKKVNNFAKKN